MPAAMARLVTRSKAAMRSEEMPNSSRRSKAPPRAASLRTSADFVIVSKAGSPFSLFTRRVMCLSRIRLRNLVGIASMN
jgi:hypothetical protein